MAGAQELALAQLPQQVDAAAVGQPHVEQRSVGALGRGFGFGDAAREGDGVAFALQNQTQRAADIVFVVQNENAFRGHGSHAAPALVSHAMVGVGHVTPPAAGRGMPRRRVRPERAEYRRRQQRALAGDR